MLIRLRVFFRSHLPLALFILIFASLGTYFLISSFADNSPATYYIDYSTGSDSNSGTSMSSPWKEAPGMQGFCPGNTGGCSTYTHQAGDHFIFKGGVTWPNAVFPLFPVGGGTAGNDDYYGIDQSWYTGSSFAQPIFDAQSENINGTDGHGYQADDFFYLAGTDYITIDDIEFLNWTASNLVGTYGSCAVVQTGGETNITINRILVTGMSIDASGSATKATCAVVFGNTQSPFGGNDILEGSTITGGDNTFGVAVWGIGNVENNTISGLTGMLYPLGGGTIGGNNLSDCGYTSAPAGASGVHGDMLLINGGPGTYYIHDNVIRDSGEGSWGECESMWVGNDGETDYIYNNVIYDLHGSGPMKIGDNNQQTSAGTAYVWDNTLTGAYSGTSYYATPCITGYSSAIPSVKVTIQNNICVSDSGSALGTFYCSDGTNGCQTFDHNLLLTSAQASSDASSGTLSNSTYQYALTGPASPGVGAGANLSSDCTGALASLCSDTTYAGARTTVARPSTGPWDIGAYQYVPPSADLNSDSHVNIFDLSIFLDHLGQTGSNLPGDFNSDGTVNSADLSILEGQWGG